MNEHRELRTGPAVLAKQLDDLHGLVDDEDVQGIRRLAQRMGTIAGVNDNDDPAAGQGGTDRDAALSKALLCGLVGVDVASEYGPRREKYRGGLGGRAIGGADGGRSGSRCAGAPDVEGSVAAAREGDEAKALRPRSGKKNRRPHLRSPDTT